MKWKHNWSWTRTSRCCWQLGLQSWVGFCLNEVLWPMLKVEVTTGGGEESAGWTACDRIDLMQGTFLQEDCGTWCLQLQFGECLYGEIGFLPQWMLEHCPGTPGHRNGFVCSDKDKAWSLSRCWIWFKTWEDLHLLGIPKMKACRLLVSWWCKPEWTGKRWGFSPNSGRERSWDSLCSCSWARKPPCSLLWVPA